MARRNEDDLFNKILIGTLIAAAGAIWGAIISSENDPAQELHSGRNNGLWQTNIEPVTCPHCRVVNESYEDMCFRCGQKLAPLNPIRKEGDLFSSIEKNWWWLLIVFLPIFLLLLFFIVSI